LKAPQPGASNPDPSEGRVQDALDVDRMLGSLGELIRYDSLGGRETPIQRYMAEVLDDLGMEVDLWELDMEALALDPACSMEIPRKEALGVVGALGVGKGPTLVLNGHVDVVPAGDPGLWSVPPWEATIRDGKVWGRGSADMKGGLAAALCALRALRDAGVEPGGRVLLQSVVGEEDGGVGTLAAVRRGHTGDAGVVLEPTRLVVAPAQAGALNFRVTIRGRAAHGALRGEGVSPIEKLIPVYRALQELERRRNEPPLHPLFAEYPLPYALCVGKVSSGIWASTVAESLSLEGRLGVGPEEEPDEARSQLAEALAAAAAGDPWLEEHPPELEWWGAQFEPAVIPSEHRVVTTLAGAFSDVTGTPARIQGMPYGADMRLLVNQGATPSVLFGPGDVRRAHAPDEYVAIRELEIAARTLARMILRFCGSRPAS